MLKRESFLAMASIATGGVGLLAIAWLATRQLTGPELGFFFSFLSFGNLVQLADFGLSYAALQAAARLAGTGRQEELPAVARRVAHWNLVATVIATIAVAGIGWATFRTANSGATTPVRWGRPWLAYVLAMFVTQLAVPGICLREGSGKIKEMWRLRLVQEWVGAAACLFALQAGIGLWSLSALASARGLTAAAWLRFGYPIRRTQILTPYPMRRWMREVWPFQWKIGLSGLSGFLIFRAFSPVILLEKGPIAAGQFGLAIAIMNLLIAVTSAWPMSLRARYASLMAEGRFHELRAEFPRLVRISTAFAAAAALGSSLALWWAYAHGLRFALRLTDPGTTALILAAAVAHHVVICFAMFLRAEGREPLLWPSVLGGLITLGAVWMATRLGSLRDVAITNLALVIAGIPVAFVLLRRRHILLSGPGPSEPSFATFRETLPREFPVQFRATPPRINDETHLPGTDS